MDSTARRVELRVREDGKANVSYLVFPSARGCGLGSEAVRLATRWALDELAVAAVVAVIDERNAASRATATRAGLALDGPAEPWEHSESGAMLRYVVARDAASATAPQGDPPAVVMSEDVRVLDGRRGPTVGDPGCRGVSR